MKASFFLKPLCLACSLFLAGCSQTTAPASQGVQTPLPTATNEVPLTIINEEGTMVASYRVPQLPELKPDEWPALIVFLSRADGPVLDERIATAKERRRGISAQSVISARSSYFFYQIAAQDSSDLAGYRYDVYDTEAKEIRQGAVLKIPFDGPSLSSDSSFDQDWLGSEARVSAALVAFKTQKGDFKFQRFLDPIVTSQFRTGS